MTHQPIENTINSLLWFEDPGHGWLRVPLAHLDALNIKEKITPFSYKDGGYAYLEEDLDAYVYLKTLQDAGYTVPDIPTVHKSVRHLPHYVNPAYVTNRHGPTEWNPLGA